MYYILYNFLTTNRILYRLTIIGCLDRNYIQQLVSNIKNTSCWNDEFHLFQTFAWFRKFWFSIGNWFSRYLGILFPGWLAGFWAFLHHSRFVSKNFYALCYRASIYLHLFIQFSLLDFLYHSILSLLLDFFAPSSNNRCFICKLLIGLYFIVQSKRCIRLSRFQDFVVQRSL